MSFHKYKIYKTNRLAPRCVKYWDREYEQKDYFYDWQVVVAIVEAAVPEIQSELDLNKVGARKLAWEAYCAAIIGDERSPFFHVYNDFCEQIADKEVPEFVMTQTVGVDINDGMSKERAMKGFQSWLRENPSNGNFGRYHMDDTFSVRRISKKS
jgi:hypothetical protein